MQLAVRLMPPANLAIFTSRRRLRPLSLSVALLLMDYGRPSVAELRPPCRSPVRRRAAVGPVLISVRVVRTDFVGVRRRRTLGYVA